MIRFGVLGRLREHWLAATGLALASIALALGLLPGGGRPETTVLALRHAVGKGEIVRASDVVAVPIATADRTPSMLGRLDGLAGRRTLIALAGGDFLLRGALHSSEGTALLRTGRARSRARAGVRVRAGHAPVATRPLRRRRDSRSERLASRGAPTRAALAGQ